MAAGGEPQATQAFPNPPAALYRLYTDENIQSGLAPKPPRPVQGAYQMFGAPFNVRMCNTLAGKLYYSIFLCRLLTL